MNGSSSRWALCLLLACFVASEVVGEGIRGKIDKMMRDFITEHKREVQGILNVRSNRIRRDLSLWETYTISSLDRVTDLSIPNSKCHALFHYKNETLLFTCGDAGTRSVLYRWDNGLTEEASLQLDSDIIKIETEVFNDQLYIAVVQQDGPMYIYRLVAGVGRRGLSVRTLDRIQTIKPYGLPSSALLYQFRDRLWLILVNKGYRGIISESVKTTSAVYEWNGAHFDEVYTFETTGAMAVEVCEVESTLYIGVAQYRDDNGNYQIGSPIYRFNPVQNRFEKFQVLRTNGAKDIIHFNYERRNYLAIANEMGNSVIYWWAGDQFLQWQFLPSDLDRPEIGSSMFRSIALPNHYQHILMLVQQNEFLFYIEGEDGQFKLDQSFGDLVGPGVTITDATLFRTGRGYLLLLGTDGSDQRGGSYVFSIGLSQRSEEKISDKTPLQCLGLLETEVAAREEAIELANQQLPYIWVTNKDQNIKATVSVKGGIQTDGRLSMSSGLVTVEGDVPDITPAVLEEQAEYMSELGDHIASEMENVVTKSTDQTIDGHKTFLHDVEIESGAISDIDNDVSINGQPFSELADNTLKYTGEQTFLQPVQFNRDVEAKTVILEGLLNDVDINDLMLTRGDQIVTGQHQLADVTVDGDIDTDVINDVMLDTIVTTNTAQTISGRKTFENMIVNGDVRVENTVNEVDLSEFTNRAFLTTGDQDFYGHLTFAQDVLINSDLFTSGRVAGVNVTDLSEHVVTIDTPQNIYGKTVFDENVEAENMELTGLLNGVDIGRDLFATSSDQEFTGTLRMEEVIVKGDVYVNYVNGIPLKSSAVTVNGNQQIEGIKAFDGALTVEGNIDMEEGATINGIDISELESELVLEHGSATVLGKKTFPSLQVSSLEVGMVNGHSLLDLDTLFWRKSTPQEIIVDVTIEGPVRFNSSVSTKTLNNYDLENDFVHTFGEELITGPVHFDQVTVLGDVIATGTTINDLNLAELNDKAVRIHGDYDISGRKTFTSDLNVDGNVRSPDVNGRSLNNLMLTNKDQVVTAPIRFDAPVVVEGDLIADNIDVEHTINDIDFDRLRDDVVHVDKESTVRGLKVFHGLEVGDLRVKKIDGIDIDSLFDKAMTLSEDQDITGNVEFKSSVEFKDPVQVRYVNGLDIDQHLSGVIMRDEDQVVSGLKSFSGLVTVEGNINAETVNGVSLRDLAETSLLRNTDQDITGNYVFDSDVQIDVLELDEDKMLDGTFISNLAFTNRETTFLEDVTFDGDVIFSDVTVNGLVNDCDFNDLLEQAVFKEGDQILRGRNAIGEVDVARSVVVSGLVNEVDVKHLAESVVTVDGEQEIAGSVTFQDDVAASAIDVELLNGIDINAFYEDAVLSSVEQTIKGAKRFEKELRAEATLEIQGNLGVQTVNGVDIEYLASHLVTTEGDHVIQGRKTLQSAVLSNHLVLNGALNDVRIPDSLALVDQDVKIPGRTTFVRGFSASELEVEGLIDGVDLNDVMERRVTLSTEQTITGDITFESPIHIKGNVGALSTINTIPFKSLVLANVPQVVTGTKTFVHLAVDGDVTLIGLVNDYNLTLEERRIVRVDRPAKIFGKLAFEGEVFTTGNMDVLGLVDGINVEELPFLLNSNLDGSLDSIRDLNTSLMSVHDQLNEAQSLSQTLFALVQHLELDSELPGTASRLLRLEWGLPSSLFSWTSDLLPEDLECRHASRFDVKSWNLPSVDGNLPMSPRSLTVEKIYADRSRRCRLDMGRMTDLPKLARFEDSTADVKDLKLFSISGQLYAVYLTEEAGEVLVAKLTGSGNWELKQEFSTFKSSDFDLMFVEESLLLVVANEYDHQNESSSTYSYIYAWNNHKSQFALVQSLLTDGASAVAIVPEKRDVFLLMGQSKNTRFSHRKLPGYPTQVFKYDTAAGMFRFVNSIHQVSSVSAFCVFELVGEVWVAAASNEQGVVNLLRWNGAAGFASVLRVPKIGVSDVQVLTVNGRPKLLASLDTGRTLVLTIKINGPRQLW